MVLITLLGACSGDTETTDNEGDSPRVTDAVAEKIVESINRPIDKAEAVKGLSEDRGKKLEEQAAE
jgi:hypothetical protein